MGASTKNAKTTAPTAEDHAAAGDEIATEAALAEEAKPAKKTKEERSLERFPVLDAEIAAEIASRARPASAPCLCGCGTLTKGRFAPGHDALLKERLTNTANHGTEEAKASATAALATFGW